MKLAVAFTLAVALVAVGCQGMPTDLGDRQTNANVASIESGASKAYVRQTLGQPDTVEVYHRLNQEVWRYANLFIDGDGVWVTFSLDGLVTEVQRVPNIEFSIGLFD